MPIYLKDLIDQLPLDTEDQVKKAKVKHNDRIRASLRHETGLKLSRGESESGNASRTAIPISFKAGVPAELAHFTIPDEHRLAVLLSPYRISLQQVSDSSRRISKDLVSTLSVHTRGFNLLNGRQRHLEPCWELAEDLLREGDKYDLAKEVLAVEKDILGRYIYRKPNLFSEPDCSIELYWGIIGLISSQIGVDIEDLTVVILAHELAHAYTHMGLDIDERNWATESFGSSEIPVVEGLAQHYTMLVTKRISTQAPNALETYRRLLQFQPSSYLVQIPWETAYSPEHMRLALIRTRRYENGVTLREFEAELKAAKGQLR